MFNSLEIISGYDRRTFVRARVNWIFRYAEKRDTFCGKLEKVRSLSVDERTRTPIEYSMFIFKWFSFQYEQWMLATQQRSPKRAGWGHWVNTESESAESHTISLSMCIFLSFLVEMFKTIWKCNRIKWKIEKQFSEGENSEKFGVYACECRWLFSFYSLYTV